MDKLFSRHKHKAQEPELQKKQKSREVLLAHFSAMQNNRPLFGPPLE